MIKKYQEVCSIIRQEEIGTDIYAMWLSTENIAKAAVPGQFVSVYCNEGSRILPRPISICEVKDDKTALKIVYRVVGKGTDEFCKLKSGDKLRVLGPIGNGYTLRREKALLVAGGIGVPPMVELAKQLKASGVEDIAAVVGYRDELFLKEKLEQYCKVYVATEDGSYGTKGNVLDAIKQEGLECKVIYSCGPMPMLKALAAYAEENDIEAQISLEERMACGIGACLGCITKTKKKDSHSNVNNARICVDGPVFDSREVDFS